jgi:hypothetical protein
MVCFWESIRSQIIPNQTYWNYRNISRFSEFQEAAAGPTLENVECKGTRRCSIQYLFLNSLKYHT